ncbi:MAG TPA: type I-E CRISPR-associated protein Cas6/Cse3/CasE, partial [Synergistaceae bacterium]|nr:type I-E CRISPR-associated protein Cas6/Cse3/CasE [Synergistaceae bacterium]
MKLYLSRLLLNQYSRRGMSEIMHPYEMHRTLMRAFPGPTDNARQEFGVLFRAESGEYGKPLKVYVQSLVEPDWSFLEDLGDYLYPSVHGISYEYKDILEA